MRFRVLHVGDTEYYSNLTLVIMEYFKNALLPPSPVRIIIVTTLLNRFRNVSLKRNSVSSSTQTPNVSSIGSILNLNE